MLRINKIFKPGTSVQDAENYFFSLKESHRINHVNWSNYPYKPEVSFKIGHSGIEIYLQYLVKEKYIRAKYKYDNDPVWTDSCVEFFFSPVLDGTYYNFEFNCIGTALLGFGSEKQNRERAGTEITSKIKRSSSLGYNTFESCEGDFSWTLTLVIPLNALFKHEIGILSGLKAKANFYKCGDELKKAHYLSWNPIDFEMPDFHRPESFNDLFFE